jgi:dienelactone hydrolase
MRSGSIWTCWLAVGCSAAGGSEASPVEMPSDTGVHMNAPGGTSLQPPAGSGPSAPVIQGSAARDPRPPNGASNGEQAVGSLDVDAPENGSSTPSSPVAAEDEGNLAPVLDDADPTEASLTSNGPYDVGSYSSGFTIGPDFPGGTIWHPENGTPPYTSIAIVPGFISPRILIEGWGPFLASHGIVTFTIDTNLVTDQPQQRSRALLNALESLAAENTRSGSPLQGELDTERQAVGGWSMGGGGTLLTANGHPEFKAAIGMCSWSPGGRFSADRVPTLLFASAGDPLAGGQSQGFYRSIPESTPKMLFEWGAADHLMANAPSGALGQVGRFGLSWLKVFLEGDERYRQFLTTECNGCTDFQSNL